MNSLPASSRAVRDRRTFRNQRLADLEHPQELLFRFAKLSGFPLQRADRDQAPRDLGLRLGIGSSLRGQLLPELEGSAVRPERLVLLDPSSRSGTGRTLQRRRKGVPIDQPGLKGDQCEEEIAFIVGSGHRSYTPVSGCDRWLAPVSPEPVPGDRSSPL